MFTYRTRRLIKTEDLNPRGTLFGGRLLEWIDEEASIFCFCQLGTRNIVTVHMSEINFQYPAKLGDVIEFGTDIVSFGSSSITLKMIVRNKRNRRKLLSVDKIVFVSLNEFDEPSPHGVSEFSIDGRWKDLRESKDG